MNLKSNKPLYLQVESDIRNAITLKKYRPGEKLPTETELSNQYQVSKITIRKAMEKLSDDGLIQKVQGKGTFISYQKEKYHLNKTRGFNDTLSGYGHIASHRILQASFFSADKNVSDKLQIPENSSVIYVERLMMEDMIPIGVDRVYMSEEQFPDFITKLQPDKSLYQILQEDYAIVPATSTLEINGIIATNNLADLLKCNIGDPLFHIEKTGYQASGVPIHYSITTLRCDRATYVVTINDMTSMDERIN